MLEFYNLGALERILGHCDNGLVRIPVKVRLVTTFYQIQTMDKLLWDYFKDIRSAFNLGLNYPQFFYWR